MRKIILTLIFLSGVAAMASAQDMSTEIELERTIVPHREAAHPLQSVQPSTLATETPEVHLTPGSPVSIPDFDPLAGFADPITVQKVESYPYKGYVGVGYLPAHNYLMKAGYSFLKTARTNVDAQVGLKGYSYNGAVYDFTGKASLIQPEIRVAAFHKFATHTLLEARAGFSYDRLKSYPKKDIALDQGVTRGWFSGRFTTLTASRKLAVDLDLRHIGASIGTARHDKSSSTIFGIAATLEPKCGNGWDACIEARMQHREGQAYNREEYIKQNCGIFSLTPGYRFKWGLAAVRLGLRFDITAGGYDSGLHLAPDAFLTIQPLDKIHFFVNVKGGEHFCSQERMYRYSPFATGSDLFFNSYTPVDGRAGFTFGPWDFGKLTIYVHYLRSNDVPMPLLTLKGLKWESLDLYGFSGGAKLELTPLKWLKFKADAQFFPDDYHNSTPDNIDRARVVLDCDLTMKPIDPLDIGICYSLRSGRRFFTYSTHFNGPYDAGDFSDLHLYAGWRLTQPLSVFFDLKNILNKRAELLPSMKNQGIHGLVGAIYRF